MKILKITAVLAALCMSGSIFAHIVPSPCCPGACCPNTLNTKAEIITMKHSPKLIDKLIHQAKAMKEAQYSKK
jgi:hypothetical protein